MFYDDVFLAEDDEDSEDESSDESDLSESEDESDEEGGNTTIHYDLDVCPQGCDQNIYDNTTSLREKRCAIIIVLASKLQ